MKFADKYHCQPVERYDAMLGQVDAIAFGGFYEIPWQHLLARPYVETGVPTYLSRPFAYRLCDIDDILERAAKHSTPLMATSVFEHFPHANILKERLPNLGAIQSVYGNCRSSEYPAHFHIQFFLLKVMGYEVDQVSLLTDDERQCTYLQDTILFKETYEQPPFLATLHTSSDTPHLHFYVAGDKGDEAIEVSRSPDPKETLYNFFAPQLLDMQRTFLDEPYQSFDIIRKKTQMFLAGYYSHLERGGAFVSVDSVPLDWSPRHYKPGWIDDSMFQGG